MNNDVEKKIKEIGEALTEWGIEQHRIGMIKGLARLAQKDAVMEFVYWYNSEKLFKMKTGMGFLKKAIDTKAVEQYLGEVKL